MGEHTRAPLSWDAQVDSTHGRPHMNGWYEPFCLVICGGGEARAPSDEGNREERRRRERMAEQGTAECATREGREETAARRTTDEP